MSELMRKIELLWGVPVFLAEGLGKSPRSFGNFLVKDNPLLQNPVLTEDLISQSLQQEVPVVYRDEFGVYFLCIKAPDGFYLSGPVCTEKLTVSNIHRYCRSYGMEGIGERQPHQSSLSRILTFASLLYELTHDQDVTPEELLRENHLVEQTEGLLELEDLQIEMRNIDEELEHHTYQEERYVMDCIREGNVEELSRRMDALLERSGILSSNQVNHSRNLAIVSVTTATREAIAGGVSPAAAYRLSDILINRIDKCTKIEEFTAINRSALYEFAKMVADMKKKKICSNYTEQCKDYIHKNYHQKIYVEKVAQAIGVSQGHLSRVFRENEGISIQDYIQKFRVERATNLLKFSEASLTEISDYVCFNSQSHFGSVFKKYMGMTPGEYREKYKKNEFRSKNTSES